MTEQAKISAFDFMDTSNNDRYLISWWTGNKSETHLAMFPFKTLAPPLSRVHGIVNTDDDFVATELNGITWMGKLVTGLTISLDREWAARKDARE